MDKIMPLSEVKTRLNWLLVHVIRNEDHIIITRNGKAAAVLMSAEEYGGWKETQEIKRNPELMQEIRQGLKRLQKGKTKSYTLDELFGPSAS